MKQILTPLKFVVIARLLPLKNIDKVINALSVTNEDFIFDIYGDGPEFNRLQEIIKANGMESKVFLKGRVLNSRLPNILSTENAVNPEYDLLRQKFEGLAGSQFGLKSQAWKESVDE